MPCDYSKYPPDWKKVIRPRILKRADNKCEFCGINNYAIGYRDDSGKFYESLGHQQDADDIDGYHLIRIVLTIAHLDHDA